MNNIIYESVVIDGMKVAKLLLIDPVDNKNKFYNMKQIDSNDFEVNYGRVSAKGAIVKYPMTKWDELYREKRRKGYNDITSDYEVKKIASGSNDMSNIKPSVKKQLELLHKYAKAIFDSNYNVEITDITQGLVDKAQILIDEINGLLKINADLPTINMKLIRLFNVIPRKMTKVKDSLMPNGINNQQELDICRARMEQEQDLLDTIKGQLNAPQSTQQTQSKVITYLDKLGLDFDEVSSSEEAMLKKMMTDSSSKYISAYKVTNFKTQKNFDNEVAKSSNKKTMLLFHGSKSGNWLNILKTGLVLHPNATTTGALFDQGIYFADIADKSLGYISGGRWNSSGADNDNWLAVYEVHVGNQADYNTLKATRNIGVNLAKWVPSNGYDSYYANRNIEQRYNLRRDEFIIYNEKKCTIKYLIHL